MKRVLVSGARGKMGEEVVKLVARTDKFNLVGAVDINNVGEDIKELLGLAGEEVLIESDLTASIKDKQPDVIVDFTAPSVVMGSIKTAIELKRDIVVGTTGITEADLAQIEELNQAGDSKIIIAPNFAIGAILMMQFAKKTAKFMNDVEIVELHHDAKIDAPSGTAIKTAELIRENLTKEEKEVEEIEKIPGARGGELDGINIHSIRLPGLVAHQEVIFGGLGQTFKLRHDSINRESFMPGVKLAIEKLDEIDGLVYGLDNLIEL